MSFVLERIYKKENRRKNNSIPFYQEFFWYKLKIKEIYQETIFKKGEKKGSQEEEECKKSE